MLLLLTAPALAAVPVPPSTADATLSGVNRDRFGFQMRSGDLNADGIADVVVTAPRPSTGNRVYVFFGPIDLTGSALDATAADVTIESANVDETGWSVAIGDVSGDGTLDLLVGSPNADLGKGAVSVFRGPLSPNTLDAQADADLVISGQITNGYVAWSLAAGDWDGDGIDELGVGACGEGSFVGNAYLFDVDQLSGSPTTADATATFAGMGWTGCAIADLGDFDGDGIDDLGIGSEEALPTNHGAVSIVYGRTTFAPTYQLDSSRSPTDDIANLFGEHIVDRFGGEVAPAGDLNRDGLYDFLAGSVGWHGRAYVILGGISASGGRPLVGDSDVDDVADVIYEGGIGTGVGRSLASAGWAGPTWGDAGLNPWGAPDLGPTLLIGSENDRGWIVGYPTDLRLQAAPTYTCTTNPDTGRLQCVEVQPPRLGARRFDLSTLPHGHVLQGAPGSAMGLEVLGIPDQDGDGLNEIAIAETFQATFESPPPSSDGVVYVFRGQ